MPPVPSAMILASGTYPSRVAALRQNRSYTLRDGFI